MNIKKKYNAHIRDEDIDLSDIPYEDIPREKWVRARDRRPETFERVKAWEEAQEKIKFNSDNPIKGNDIEIEE